MSQSLVLTILMNIFTISMMCVYIVIFDPATFYGHHEYDIASISLFGGTSMDFFEAYFKKIPKSNGFEKRKLLYHLFHYLNHWYEYIVVL